MKKENSFMQLPDKILQAILNEAYKNAGFRWFEGWEKSSGYIKSELRGDCRFGTCRLYVKWTKKKPPTDDQIKIEIAKNVESLINNGQHPSTQRDFTHYVLETFYRDVQKAKNDVMLHLEEVLTLLLKILENSDDFIEPQIQGFHNELKNFEAVISDHEALTKFLDFTRGRNEND